jgi:hypothetical protein
MREHPLLLEISAWPWLERVSREERHLVTLANVPAAHWDRLARDGFDVLFLMGVWRRSAIGRDIARTHPGIIAEFDRVLPGWSDEDVPGSPYSIQAYEPDERMGGWHGLDAARRELKSRGISLLLDFVPNHTGFDHAWIQDHPELYVLGTEADHHNAPADFRAIHIRGRTFHVACGRDPYFAPWTDVAQLNYFNPDTRTAMRATLQDIAAHCDGVRCDMAMLVLNDVFERTWRGLLRDAWPPLITEFWPDTTRTIPELLYLAEVYWGLEGRMLEQGFTFAYDKRLLDGLHSPDRAARTRELLAASIPDPARLSRFLENHDEPRSAATLAAILPAAACLLASSPGMRFFFDGQLDGRRVKAPVQLGRWPEEPAEASVRALYERVLVFAGYPVLHDGASQMLNVSAAGDSSFVDIVAYRWRTDSALALVVVNLGASTSQAYVAIAADLPPGTAFDFEDCLTEVSYRRTRESLLDRGLFVRLEAGRAHLFTVHC